MTTIQDTPRYASPVDYEAYGEYGPGRGFERGQSFQRPRYRFQGRITADGSSGYQAEPGRYHLYISWGCPWAQRTAIVRKLMGLEDVVSLSYVDDQRDGRGWAFRERRGPDPVNGFRFLAEAYEATEPGYDGHVSVPALWDRKTSRLVSNNFPDITIDLGTQFGPWADPALDLYPMALRAEINALNERVYQTVNNGTYLVAGATTEEDYQRTAAAPDRHLRRTGRAAGRAPVPVRRGHHRGRRAAVAHPGPVRPELQPAGEDQRAAADRLPKPVGLRP